MSGHRPVPVARPQLTSLRHRDQHRLPGNHPSTVELGRADLRVHLSVGQLDQLGEHLQRHETRIPNIRSIINPYPDIRPTEPRQQPASETGPE